MPVAFRGFTLRKVDLTSATVTMRRGTVEFEGTSVTASSHLVDAILAGCVDDSLQINACQAEFHLLTLA